MRHLRAFALVATLGVGLTACGNAGTSSGAGGSGTTGGALGTAGSVASQAGGSELGGGGTGGGTAGGAATSGGATGGVAAGGSGASAGSLGGDGGRAGSSGAAGAGGGGAGAGGAAGNVGAGGAAGSGGVSACGGLLCEDFETGKLDAEKWELVSKSGTVAVQGQRVAHGGFAAQLHGTAGPSDDWALLVAKHAPSTLAGSDVYGRAMLYVESSATSSIHVQFAFAGRTGTGSGNGPAPFAKLRYMEIGSNAGRWQLGFDLLDLSPLVEEVSYSDGRIATGGWQCLEWRFEDQPDRVTAWVAGTQVSSFDNTNVDYASPGPVPKSGAALWDGKSSGLVGGFDTFGFGFHDWHPQREFDLYFDDVVFDTKRIGCPAKQ